MSAIKTRNSESACLKQLRCNISVNYCCCEILELCTSKKQKCELFKVSRHTQN